MSSLDDDVSMLVCEEDVIDSVCAFVRVFEVVVWLFEDVLGTEV